MDHTELHSNISQVRSRIFSAANAAKRAARDIRLIAVSKTKPVEDIRAAFHAGISDFGENYVAESVDKCSQCGDLDITWHFLGPLQSNKVGLALEVFDVIQTIDREKIVKKIKNQIDENFPNKDFKFFIQINI